MARAVHVLLYYIQVSLTGLILKYKIQKNSLSQAMLVRLILIKTK